MEKDLSQFIRNKEFLDKIVSAEEAASWIIYWSFIRANC